MGALERNWELVKQEKEKEKYYGEARNMERKCWYWSMEMVKTLCQKTSQKVCFVEKTLKEWTKAVPTKVSYPQGDDPGTKKLESVTLGRTLVKASKHE